MPTPWAWTQMARAKVGKMSGKESRMIVVLLIMIPAAVFILLTEFFIVSITWTHRPDLRVGDILREILREIFGIRKNESWQRYSGKERENEQDYHL